MTIQRDLALPEAEMVRMAQARLIERRAADAHIKAQLRGDEHIKRASQPPLFDTRDIYAPTEPRSSSTRATIPTFEFYPSGSESSAHKDSSQNQRLSSSADLGSSHVNTVTHGVTYKAEAARATMLKTDTFTQAFQAAERIALEQFEPFRADLRSLFDLAVTVRACCLMFNPKALPRATLCAMVPLRFLIEALDGRSSSYIYRLLRNSKEGAFFKRLISFDAHISDHWITAKKGATKDQPARATNGTLFCSRPLPLPEGESPVPRYWDWRRHWRDLSADVRDGRTVSAVLAALSTARAALKEQGSDTQADKGKMLVIQSLKNFYYLSSTEFYTSKSVAIVCEPEKFACVQDALELPVPSSFDGRQAWVERIASLLYSAVHDTKLQDKQGWLAVAWTAAKALVFDAGRPAQIILEALYTTLNAQFEGREIRNLGAYTRKLMNEGGWTDLERVTDGLKLGRSAQA